MNKEFFYVQPTSWSPTEPFYAIKNKGRLIPCSYQSDAKNGKYEAFVRGDGWMKSKKAIEVPLPTGDYKEYLDKWGEYCLFYGITGFQRHSNDCVVWAADQEFSVALQVGLDYVKQIVSEIHSLNETIRNIVFEKHGVDILCEAMQYTNDKKLVWKNLFKVKPHYSLIGYCLCAPHIDPVSDDDKLWKHFIEVEGIENEDKFPVSVKDRMTYLFSEDVATRYEKIMKAYPLSYTPKKGDNKNDNDNKPS